MEPSIFWSKPDIHVKSINAFWLRLWPLTLWVFQGCLIFPNAAWICFYWFNHYPFLNGSSKTLRTCVVLMRWCVACRPGDLLQHAGLSGWSVVGHAGGQDVPAVSKCCGSHSGPQVLLGVFQMVRNPPPPPTWCQAYRFNTVVCFTLQGVAKSCPIETTRGQ